MPKSRRRYAGADAVDVLPFRSQKVVLRLSPLERIVRSRMSKQFARASRCRSPPASSRSEFVMLPEGLESVTSRDVMSCGHAWRQTSGALGLYPTRGARPAPGNQIPPAPAPDASWCPSATGGNGIISAMRVGRSAMLAFIQRKSSRASWTPLASAIRPFDWRETACCIALKMFRAPGRASAIERSSPRAACQRLMLVRR